jgi:phosphodiesterase/alkaline phosphatase D-like protein
MAPKLILGPLLRHVGPSDATVWIETDAPCEAGAELAGTSHRSRTFSVEGHDYALLKITDLEPGSSYEYAVTLDGERVWPEPHREFPASVIRTIVPDDRLTLAFGSCRVSVPHELPYTKKRGVFARGVGGGYERDVLHALALRMRSQPQEEWPDALLLLGDQIYADEVSEGTLEFIRSRRDTSQAPGEEVADFEEYTRLYWDAWRDPAIRWLLSTVPSSMIFDDHDVHDDWNISESWLEVAPRGLAASGLFERVRDADDA